MVMKSALFLADGFETCEALLTLDLLRRANMLVDTVSISDSKTVSSSHEVKVEADKLMKDISFEDYELLILPGGKVGTENLMKCEKLGEALQRHYIGGHFIAAICAAPSVLGELDILKGKNYTCYPGFEKEEYGTYQDAMVIRDGTVITGKGLGVTFEFAKEIISLFRSEEIAQEVIDTVYYQE